MRYTFLLLLLCSVSVCAQTLEEVTRDMTPRQREIFMRNAIMGSQMREIDDRNAARRQQVEEYQQVRNMRLALARDWQELGLDEKEAAAVAQVYNWTDSQVAVAERIEREGAKAGVQQAIAAYQAFNYQLANELLIGAVHALHTQKPATENKPPDQGPVKIGCGPPYPCVK